MASVMSDDEEGDVCRICRSGPEPDDPLYHPCKCSGSIRHVHQQCLLDWLQHSGHTHCEVCKHKFSFTPVYASNAPSKLPWHEVLLGACKRALRGIKVAHRVWLVSCFWLLLVPWLTSIAWRLAFLQSFAQVPVLLKDRVHPLAVATDCVQGSLLSILIVFLNTAFASGRDLLRSLLAGIESNAAAGAGAAAAAAGAGAGAGAAPAAAAPGGAGGAAAPAEQPAVAPIAVGAEAHQDDAAAAAAPEGEEPGEEAAAEAQRWEVLQWEPPPAYAPARAPPHWRQLQAAALPPGVQPLPDAAPLDAAAVEAAGARVAGALEAAAAHEAAAAAAERAALELPGVVVDEQDYIPPVAGAAAAAPPPEAGAAPPRLPTPEAFPEALRPRGPPLPQDVLERAGAGEAADDPPGPPAAAGDDPALEAGIARAVARIRAAAPGVAAAQPAAAAAAGGGGGGEEEDAALARRLQEEDEAWADMPLEELLGLQGPWRNLLETVALVVIGNFFFVVAVVYLPLNLGRTVLRLMQEVLLSITAEQQQVLRAVWLGQGSWGWAQPLVQLMLSVLLPLHSARLGGLNATAVAAAAAAAVAATGPNTTALAGGGSMASLAPGAVLLPVDSNASSAGYNSTLAVTGVLEPGAAAAAMAGAVAALTESEPSLMVYPPEPMPILSVTMEQLMEELYSQLELPSSSDFVALAIGHGVLCMLCMLGLWAYVSVRMYKVHSRRLRGRGQPSLIQLVWNTRVWVLGALRMVGNFVKLGLMVILELLVFPVGVGFWLDVCVLPLSQSNLAERVAHASAAPLLSCFVHWVLGIGFLLAYTYGVMVAREVLRPGALPFLKDPSRADRNPFLETMARPLHKLLSRLVLSSLVAAGLCVVTVHLPALLAKALVPQLLPLRVNLFDQLTAIPADLLLSHIFLPFALEHVKLREACRAFTRAWLTATGWCLGLTGYLLPAQRRPAPPPPPALAAPQPPAEPAAAAPAAAAVPPPAVEGGVSGTAEAVPAGTQPGQLAGSRRSTGEQQEDHQGSSSSSRGDDQGVASAAGLHPSSSSSSSSSRSPVDVASSSSSSSSSRVGLPGPVQQEQQVPAAAPAPAQQVPPQQVPPQQQQQQQHQVELEFPVDWYHQQPDYSHKLLLLLLAWMATAAVVNTLLLVGPVVTGRWLFSVAQLPFKSDLFTGSLGALVLWGVGSLVHALVMAASLRNLRAVAAAGLRWAGLVAKCGLLALLWFGVVGTLVGLLCELVLLPLRLPPNQTALIYIYQDWTMGALALKLWHLLIMLAPRREGAAPPPPDSWRAQFEALQQNGLRNLDFGKAMTGLVLPVLLRLGTSLSVPYVVTKGLLPLLGLPAKVLQYAGLYGYLVYHVALLVGLGVQQLRRVMNDLHDSIRDDKYLVGKALNNFQREEAAAAAAAAKVDAALTAAAALAAAAGPQEAASSSSGSCWDVKEAAGGSSGVGQQEHQQQEVQVP